MSGASPQGSDAQRAAWQTKLLPLMSAFLVLGAIFFAVMSIFELRDFYARVEQRPIDFEQRLAAFEHAAEPQVAGSAEYLRFKVLATLEADALQRRYQQANATMLARVWTRQLGFITGMLLALVGAAFILGRLSEPPTRLEAGGEGWKGVLETSSPGLVLAVLGSALMALTIWIPFGVETRDVNTYLRAADVRLPPPSQEMPKLSDPEAVLKREQELFPPQGDTASAPAEEKQ